MNARDAQFYARVAGILLVVSLVAGGFGESYVPDKLMAANDPVEVARTMAASVGLFRASFAVYLIEAMCDVTLTAIFYILLRPVSRPLSLIVVCFGILSTATFAAGEIFYFSAALPVIDSDVAKALTPDARTAFIYLCLTVYGYVFSIFAAFYGIAVMLRGYLIFRSGYLPRVLGALIMLGGASFIVKNFTAVLMPQCDSALMVLPMLIAMASMAFWFIAKGIDCAGWQQLQGVQER
ncbi:DUF4386 domain-containing protein [Dyella caseinilytica]|uniref:DUF4386 domain-containing protein n=1 Tax=Dyella caseinilytica TaxID=1849581 RepID=A0ABX7GNM5_9GAMM|nr:DUF4386 domain-containing protein [Dyella caseinilytica]QRN51977.1 DUF4386 domain-containing protein [Dyella caseinilytica]GGA04075.1 hypothetical protein GCM10011408_27120 [Dyella caseinilytica]